jgi:hypothetical protein
MTAPAICAACSFNIFFVFLSMLKLLIRCFKRSNVAGSNLLRVPEILSDMSERRALHFVFKVADRKATIDFYRHLVLNP